MATERKNIKRNASRPLRSEKGHVATMTVNRYQQSMGLSPYERWLNQKGLY